MKPGTVNICGIPYTVEYVDHVAKVTKEPRPCSGGIDLVKREIRILDKDRPVQAVWHTLLHETLHGISRDLYLVIGDESYHDQLDQLALALMDFLFRNGIVNENTPLPGKGLVISRADLEALSPRKRAEFFSNGGRVTKR